MGPPSLDSGYAGEGSSVPGVPAPCLLEAHLGLLTPHSQSHGRGSGEVRDAFPERLLCARPCNGLSPGTCFKPPNSLVLRLRTRGYLPEGHIAFQRDTGLPAGNQSQERTPRAPTLSHPRTLTSKSGLSQSLQTPSSFGQSGLPSELDGTATRETWPMASLSLRLSIFIWKMGLTVS